MAKPKAGVVQPRVTAPTTHPVPAAFWGEAVPKWDAEKHLQHCPNTFPTLTMETRDPPRNDFSLRSPHPVLSIFPRE